MVNKAAGVRADAAKSAQLAEEMRRASLPIRQWAVISKALDIRAKALPDKERRDLAGSIMRHSTENGHDPFLLMAVIETESSFRKAAVSSVGAVGLMQVRPFVARGIAKEMNLRIDRASLTKNPDLNVRLGAYYLAKMLKTFDGDLSLALEAYNRGPYRLKKHIRKGSTLKRRYTKKVFKSFKQIKRLVNESV